METQTVTEEPTVEQTPSVEGDTKSVEETVEVQKLTTDSVVEEIVNFCVAIPKRNLMLMKVMFGIFLVLMLVIVFNSLLKAFSHE